ncbi:MAG: FYDLN acid domain-containing protein [Hyphomicrobiaceae bacterium]
MVGNAARGTKLKCQNEDCALPFYDLNVAQPDCPTCGTAFDHEAAKELINPNANYGRSRRQQPVFEIVAPEAADQRATDEIDDTDEAGEDAVLDVDEDDTDDENIPVRTENSPD